MHYILENLDDLNEGVREEYEELEDGRFRLKLESLGDMEVADTGALKRALENEREAARKARENLRRYTEAGIEDPAAAKAAIDKVAEMADWDPDKKAEEAREALRTEMARTFGNEKKELETKIGDYRDQLEKILRKDALVSAITRAKGNIALLQPALMPFVQMRESDDGKLVVKVVNEDGSERIGSSDGSAMSIDQLVAEVRGKREFSAAFDGVKKDGVGSSTETVEESKGGGGEGATRHVKASDREAVNASIEDIAAGKVIVDFE